jgi:fructose-1,6-bisphosphatase/inositol monophosphatase family enzyme
MRAELERIAQQVMATVKALPYDFDRGKELGMGADGTPTANIDKVAEDVILRAVEEMDLPVNVLSEEAGLVDRGHQDTLVIDPIDGTFNSLLGIPLYSVSLAWGRKSLYGVRTAVLLDLVSGDLFWAEKEKGAYLNGRKLAVKSLKGAEPAMLFYLGRYAHPRTFELVKRSARVRALGCASLEMALVAQGRFDAYYFHSDVYEKGIRIVDIAASALLLREAGGEVVDLDGKPLDMPFELGARSNFLAYGDPIVKEVML